MAQIPFNVSARTARLIGQENFSNAEGAIIELVKNSFDADAKNCIIVFNNETLYIIDNGDGMTDKKIETHWMTIGTDDKLRNTKSEEGRIKTGAKGIGRFALDKLGLFSEMNTRSKETQKGYKWSVDWSSFDRIGVSINEVKADLSEVEDFDYEKYLTDLFPNFSEFQDILKKSSFKFGTTHAISPLKDKWDEENIKSLFGNLEVLIPPREQPEFEIHLFSTKQKSEYGIVNGAFYDDYDYKLKATYSDGENKALNVTITRNELNLETLEKDYTELFEYSQMQKFPYDLDTFKKKSFDQTYLLSELKGFSNVSPDLIDRIGQFGFTLYFLKNTISDDREDADKKKYPYRSFESAARKAWLNKFGGVKIFRDDFRVRPYGENGEDWLKLGERQSKSPGGAGQKLGGYRIRPNQITGTISISRLTNISFQDKSGREGIQENEVFELFKNFILNIISLFEQDRNIVMYHLSELSKKRFKDEEIKRKAKAEAERIAREKEQEEEDAKAAAAEARKKKEEKKKKANTNTDPPEPEPEPKKSNISEAENILAQGNMLLEQELEEKEKEIQLLRNLASIGLIISSFAHEVKSLRSRLIPRTEFLIQTVKNLIGEEKLKTLAKEDNPVNMLQLIQEEDIKLKHWLDYSLNSLRKDKRTRKNLNFGDYFEQFKATWEKALKQRNISIKLAGTKDAVNTIRAFEVDMDSIFNNLLSNSINALQSVQHSKEITINWVKKGTHIEIIFADNGVGLSKEYEKNPDDIFNAHETSKTDRKGNIVGTGLGLYLVKTIVSEHPDASIEIMQQKNGFALKILFLAR